ncbi:MAG: glyceraldehyde-3-phosphate dehydrogenase [Chitinophagales bacterium]|nr:glyceraldehyde-3-phosphate dehydrogenase [Chitinophagales bacterium]
MNTSFSSELKNWVSKEKLALELITHASTLYFDKNVELVLFRRKLVDKGVTEVINDHAYAVTFAKIQVSLENSVQFAKALCAMDLAPAKIDLGRLEKEWQQESTDYSNIESFLHVKLANFIGLDKITIKAKDIVLYGFGRIGRLAARILSEKVGTGSQLRLKAIVVRKKGEDDLVKRASLLRKDSVHGNIAGTVDVDHENNRLLVNGNAIQVIYANHPSEIDYTAYDIQDALIIDNMGIWKDREALSQHFEAKGASQVLLTAPAGDDIANVVYGINHKGVDIDNETIFSAASCTTNCIAPILKLVEDNYGITDGHIETIHAYTNDQNLIDNFHKKARRGRSAALNMVLTSTGAAKAAIKIFPHLKGKLTASAVRVPTPNASIAILGLNLKNKVTGGVDEMNEIFRQAALTGNLVEQIGFAASEEHVSTDVVGNTNATEIDSLNTIVAESGMRTVLYAWYDNEFGYTNQVIRYAKHIAKVRRLTYY